MSCCNRAPSTAPIRRPASARAWRVPRATVSFARRLHTVAPTMAAAASLLNAPNRRSTRPPVPPAHALPATKAMALRVCRNCRRRPRRRRRLMRRIRRAQAPPPRPARTFHPPRPRTRCRRRRRPGHRSRQNRPSSPSPKPADRDGSRWWARRPLVATRSRTVSGATTRTAWLRARRQTRVRSTRACSAMTAASTARMLVSSSPRSRRPGTARQFSTPAARD